MKRLIDKLSIRHIILAGLILRLAAVIFSKGYAFHDDHFDVVELAQKWRDGVSFAWTGRDVYNVSLIYPGIHYLIFEACEAIGIHDPQGMMLVTRLLHTLYSLLAIYYAYRLTLRLNGNADTAKLVALTMALFWLFPFMSVRSLREFACIPLLLIGSYHAADPKLSNRSLLLAAFFFSLAFCIRIQSIFIPFGTGIYFLLKKEHLKKGIAFGIAFLLFVLLTQGAFDWFYYGDPSASTREYIRFNSDPVNIHVQPQGPWYQYLGTVAAVVLGLPFILLLIGYISSARMSGALQSLFFASLLFFVFHSIYSNKQERFILPFLPYFLLLGIIGFRDYYQKHADRAWLRKMTRVFIGWFLVLNTIGLFVLVFTYSKRSRIEAMSYLRKRNDVSNIVMEGRGWQPAPPLFYLGKHISWYSLPPERDMTDLRNELDTAARPSPNYLVMVGDENLDQRVNKLKILFPQMRPLVNIQPGFIDKLAYTLNPKHNQNETWHIYDIR